MSVMYEAYIVTSGGGEDSQDNSQSQETTLVVIDNTPGGGQGPSAAVSGTANSYLDWHRKTFGDHASPPSKVSHERIDSEILKVDRAVYAFDASAKRILNYVKSSSDEVLNADFHLFKFMNKSIWKDIAKSQPEISGSKIMLFSSESCVSLDAFRDAVENLVDSGRVEEIVSAMGSMDRTKFWVRWIGTNRQTGQHYTHGTTSYTDFDQQLLRPRCTEMPGSDTSDSADE